MRSEYPRIITVPFAAAFMSMAGISTTNYLAGLSTSLASIEVDNPTKGQMGDGVAVPFVLEDASQEAQRRYDASRELFEQGDKAALEAAVFYSGITCDAIKPDVVQQASTLTELENFANKTLKTSLDTIHITIPGLEPSTTLESSPYVPVVPENLANAKVAVRGVLNVAKNYCSLFEHAPLVTVEVVNSIKAVETSHGSVTPIGQYISSADDPTIRLTALYDDQNSMDNVALHEAAHMWSMNPGADYLDARSLAAFNPAGSYYKDDGALSTSNIGRSNHTTASEYGASAPWEDAAETVEVFAGERSHDMSSSDPSTVQEQKIKYVLQKLEDAAPGAAAQLFLEQLEHVDNSWQADTKRFIVSNETALSVPLKIIRHLASFTAIGCAFVAILAMYQSRRSARNQ